MKRHTILSIAITALFSACQDAPTAVQAPPGLRPSFAAFTSTVNLSVPTAFEVVAPCGGESVALSGDLHILIHQTVNGNNVVLKTHVQPQGISGVGLVSGDSYHSTGVTQETVAGSFKNGRFVDTFVNNFRIIGQGTGNNLLVHETFHLTVNANGDVTALVDNFSAECR